MKDIALNGIMAAFLDPDRKDIAVVEGRDAFEQAVIITLHKFERGVFGETDSDNLKQKLRQLITRIARTYGEIEGIDQLVIERNPDRPDTYTVTVVYDIGTAFSEEVAT